MSKYSSDSSGTGSCQSSCDALTSDTATKTSLPPEWKTLETQVGGHQFTHGEYEHQTLGVVDLGNGLILKSLQNPPRGPRELGFYQRVFDPDCDDPDLIELRQFLPPFHGTEEKGKAKFLKLANLTSGFKHPCVADLKMGRVTYDQEATPEKIAHEVEKYPPLKKLGYQITGMMIYNPETQSNEHYDKSYSRFLTEDNIITDGLGVFFQLHKNNLRKDAVCTVVSKLKRLEAWFLRQEKLSFVASSLLIVYEGSESTEEEDLPTVNSSLSCAGEKQGRLVNDVTSAEDGSHNNSNTRSNLVQGSINEIDSGTPNVPLQKRTNDRQEIFSDERVKKVRLSDVANADLRTGSQDENSKIGPTREAEVHLIDFAHVFPANGIDHNFLFGLQKLIAALQTLLN